MYNVSIKNGNRVEIKGAQDLDLIPEIVKNEVERQKKLLEWQKEVKKSDLEKKTPQRKFKLMEKNY